MSLLSTRRFRPLFWTQFLGAFNDNFLKNALIILVVFRTSSVLGLPSAQMVSVAGGLFILPFFLFSATAGQLADRYPKDQIIRRVKLAEIAIMAIATVGFLASRCDLLLVTLFGMGTHSTFFGPVKYSILPQHLSEEELVGGNALIEAGTFLAILLGTITGGVLIALQNIGPAVVSAGLLAVAVGGYLTSRGVPAAPPQGTAVRVRWNPVPPTLEIFRLTRANRPVYRAILAASWFWLFGAAMLSLFPPYCRDILHAGEGVVTLLLATFSVGIGLGSLLCGRLSRGRLELGLVPLGSLGLSLFALDLWRVGAPAFAAATAVGTGTVAGLLREPTGWRILLDLLLLAASGGLFIVPLYTMMQEWSEPAQRSRVIALNNIVNALFMVGASMALVLLMRLGLSVPGIFLVLALANAGVAAIIYARVPEFAIRFLMYVVANVIYRLRVTGGESIPAAGPALLVCNHVSFADWMIVMAGVRRPVRFVIDHAYLKGLFRGVLRQVKVIPIATARESPALMEEAFLRIGEALRAGQLVCIFPEGRITRDGLMGAFKPGPLRILQDTPVPVIPMALRGLWGSFFSRHGGKALLKRPRRFWSRIELRIGEPVAAQGIRMDELHARVERLVTES